MIQDIDYKVPEGKLLRITADLDDDIINAIQISGDFFIHPETAILNIEQFLTGNNIQDLVSKLEEFIKKENIIVIGFNAADIVDALGRLRT